MNPQWVEGADPVDRCSRLKQATIDIIENIDLTLAGESIEADFVNSVNIVHEAPAVKSGLKGEALRHWRTRRIAGSRGKRPLPHEPGCKGQFLGAANQGSDRPTL